MTTLRRGQFFNVHSSSLPTEWSSEEARQFAGWCRITAASILKYKSNRMCYINVMGDYVARLSTCERLANILFTPLSCKMSQPCLCDYADELGTYLGRAFDITQRMSKCNDDPMNPGYVLEQSLIDACSDCCQVLVLSLSLMDL